MSGQRLSNKDLRDPGSELPIELTQDHFPDS
jgi:hypothetical protein